MARRPAQAAPTSPDASMRVVLIHGPEAFLRDAHLRALRSALEREHSDLQVATFSAGEADIADVLDEARSFALIAPHKLVIVSDADQLVAGEANRRIMERYAQSPADNATLALMSETWHKGNLDKHLAIFPCQPLNEGDALAWVIARAQREHAVTIERDAARLLIERLGTSLLRLDSELAKLAARHNPVNTDAVRSLVSRAREEIVWDMQAEILVGPPSASARKIRDAFEISRHPPVLVSYALMDLTRKLHAMSRGLADRIPPQQIAKSIRLWGDSGRAIESAARRIPPQRAAELLRRAVAQDAALKTGLGVPERGLERLAIEIAQATRPHR